MAEQVGALTVVWEALAGAESYRVQWKAEGEEYSVDRQSEVAWNAPLRVAIPNLEAGGTYTVRVSAINTEGEGPSVEVTGAPHVVRPPGDGIFWAATLTAGVAVLGTGFSTFFVDAGRLDPPRFTQAGITHTVQQLIVSGARGLNLLSNKALPPGLILHLGTHTFATDDATPHGSLGRRHLSWASSGLSWAAGDTVAVRLTGPAIPPSPPQYLWATADGQHTIQLAWLPPRDDGGSALTGYQLQESRDGRTWRTVVAETPGLTSTMTGLPAGTTVRYRVAARSGTDVVGSYSKPAQATTVAPPPPPPRSPGNGGGGGGGSGGGGGAPPCAEDLHGNTATQATAIEFGTETGGAICPAADVDYLTVTAPGSGLLFVDTFGRVPLRGTLWQDGIVRASGPTARSPETRLGARVQAGPVVLALQGRDGVTGAYDVAVTFTPGYLENPGAESFQSGVGVLSGWVCEADVVELAIGTLPVQVAAYGTERLDTAGVCEDTDNGFGLLFNWNLLGDGDHDVVALVDGVELGRATVTVTTLGAEFLRGAEGTCAVDDFPVLGETATLAWQQNSRNFVMAGGSPPAGVISGRTSALTGFLENPGGNSFQSGVGVLSGWVCDADAVELEIGPLGRQAAAYGTERRDTEAVCGDTDNGFGLLFNWNLLGDGEHTVAAFVDGVELDRATVTVTTLGAEFLRGGAGECVVDDFPLSGETVTLEWQQNQQNFVIVDIE